MVPTAPIGVDVSDGWFQRVALTNPDGKSVAGAINRDRTSFAVTEPLGYGVDYTWAGSVVGRDGKAVPVGGQLHHRQPADTGQRPVPARRRPDRRRRGADHPAVRRVDQRDKAAVEKALNVTTDPPVEGSWAWLPDEVGGSRVHWRTRDYYPAGTKVHVDAKLYGVKFGDGAYGARTSRWTSTIGRRQVVKAEASSHRIQVR